jgi:hypothetical protein
MFTKSDLEIIATVFGKKAEDVSSAISAQEEVALNLRLNGKIHTQEEIDALKKTHTDAGVEIGSKNVAKALGIELDAGEKDPAKVAEKYKAKLTAELEEKFKNPDPSKELAAAIKKQQEFESKYNTLLETHNTDKKDTFSIEEENGKTIIKRGDAIVQDAVGEAETLENVVAQFTEEKKWIKGAGMGGGGSDDTVKTPKGLTPEQATKYIEEKGVEPMSDAGLALMSQLTKAVVK